MASTVSLAGTLQHNRPKTSFFFEQFTGTTIYSTNFVALDDNNFGDDYVRHRARDILGDLQTLFSKRTILRDDKLIFVAHNVGAVLVKEVLLVASESGKYSWVPFQTVGLHLIESPSYTDPEQWERYLLRLLAAGKIPHPNLPDVIRKFPGQLARTEIRFANIAQAFPISLRNGPSEEGLFPPSEDPWVFGDETSEATRLGLRLGSVLENMSSQLGRISWQINSVHRRLQRLLCRPEATSGRLSPSDTDPRSMKWVDEHPTYKEWLESETSSLLVVTGPPGSGKTYLTSHILFSLQASNHDPETLFLSFGFHMWDTTRNSEWHLAASLVRQIILLRPQCYLGLRSLSEYIVENEDISCAQLWEVFRYLIAAPGISKVFLVVNAINQCEKPIADTIADTIASLVSAAHSKKKNIKILATGSEFADTPPEVSALRLSLGELSWHTVIRESASERVSRIVKTRPVWRGQEETIVNKLCYDDMNYLYIMLNLDIMEQSNIPSTISALRENLMTPSLSLDKVFQNLVNRVKESEAATLALNWIYYAVRPLTVYELSVAVALSHADRPETENGPLTFQDLSEVVSWDLMKDLGSYLGPIVKVVDDRVLLVHHTLRRYLEEQQNDILIPNFHSLITKQSLWYLSLCIQPETELQARLQMQADLGRRAGSRKPAESGDSEQSTEGQEAATDEKPDQDPEIKYGKKVTRMLMTKTRSPTALTVALLGYAGLYWPSHYKLAATPDDQLDDLSANFLIASATRTTDESGTAEDGAQDVPVTDEPSEAAPKPGAGPEPVENSAAPQIEESNNDNQSTDNVPRLRDEPSTVDDDGPSLRPGSPLPDDTSDRGSLRSSFASQRPASPRPASQRSTSVSASDSILSTPAEGAGLSSFSQWARMCAIAFGWPWSAEDDPLSLAVRLELHRIVRIILRDMDVAADSQQLRIQTAVIAAAETGNTEILDTMLEQFFATCRSSSVVPALCAASSAGHVECVKRLLHAIVDPAALAEAKAAEGEENPVLHAAQHGHASVVEILLEEGFSLSAYDIRGNSPVHLAARIGDAKTLRVIERLRGEQFKEMLKRTNDEDRIPLKLACMAGRVDAFNFIWSLSPKEQLEAEGLLTTLMVACASAGHTEIWEQLIKNGVDALAGEPSPLPEDMNYSESTKLREWTRKQPTALEIAVRYGQEGLVRGLVRQLESTTKNTKDAEEKERRKNSLASALFEAVGVGNAKLVEFLLPKVERNADLDAKLVRFGSGRGFVDVLRTLSAAGISMERPDDQNNSQLDLAISEKHVDVVQYLVEKGIKPVWDEDETSIHYATRCGFVASLRQLLRACDSDPDEVRRKNSSSYTALEVAAGECGLETLKELLRWEDAHPVSDEPLRPPMALILAIQSSYNTERKMETIEYLLDHGWDANANDGSTNIPLHVAMEEAEPSIVQMLLDNGANPNVCNNNNENALHIANGLNLRNLILLLLEKGADPNCKNANGMTPLHAAADARNTEVLRLLIGLDRDGRGDGDDGDGDDEDDEDDGEDGEDGGKTTPLPTADVSITGPQGRKILHYASCSLSVTESLFEGQTKLGYKLDIDPVRDVTLETPLIIAARAGPARVVDILLEHGADPRARDSENRTALHLVPLRFSDATEEEEIIRSLVRHGADINAVGNPYGPVVNFAMWTRWGTTNLLRLVLELGATADVRTPFLGTPLHAMFYGSNALEDETPALTPLLIQHGARINDTDDRGRTPLVFATSHYRPEEVTLPLLDADADPNIPNNIGSTALHYAVGHQTRLTLVERLLKAGAKADAVDGCGRSVLYCAALTDAILEAGFFEMVLPYIPEAERPAQMAAALPAAVKGGSTKIRSFIMGQAGVDLNVADRSGWTALDVADRCCMTDAVEALEKRGAVRGVDKKQPSRMSGHDLKDDLDVSGDGTEISIEEPPFLRFYSETITGTVRADHPITDDKGIFYFEVEIVECKGGNTVGIGLMPEQFQLGDMTGWPHDSWGYHSDEGALLSNNREIDTGDEYGEGNTIGMAYDPATEKLWFTRDGVLACHSWGRKKASSSTGSEAKSDAASEKAEDGETKGHETEGQELEGQEKEDREKEGREKGNQENDGPREQDKEEDVDGKDDDKVAQGQVVRGQLYPSVSLQQQGILPVRVRVNFGPKHGHGRPFKYPVPVEVPVVADEADEAKETKEVKEEAGGKAAADE